MKGKILIRSVNSVYIKALASKISTSNLKMVYTRPDLCFSIGMTLYQFVKEHSVTLFYPIAGIITFQHLLEKLSSFSLTAKIAIS